MDLGSRRAVGKQCRSGAKLWNFGACCFWTQRFVSPREKKAHQTFWNQFFVFAAEFRMELGGRRAVGKQRRSGAKLLPRGWSI